MTDMLWLSPEQRDVKALLADDEGILKQHLLERVKAERAALKRAKPVIFN